MIITNDMLENAGINIMWLDDLNIVLQEKNIIDKTEIAMLLSQCAYESKRFSMLEENLNYSPDILLKKFPNYFHSLDQAKHIYSQGVSSIGNHLYNGRFGNMPNTNDGYAYRARGILKIIGRDNYKKYSKHIGVDLLSQPILVKHKRNALLIAIDIWQSLNCTPHAQKADVLTVTNILTGSYAGSVVREKIFWDYESIFC